LNEENYIMVSLMICTLTQYLSDDKIEKNEMYRALSAYGREERRTQVFGGEN
jgi:hypothetical protein